MFDQHAIFVDLETTGTTVTHDCITEIGIVEVDHGRYVGEWSTLINPGISIPPMIQSLTGITNDMVALAPTFAEVSPELQKRLDGKLLIAHNARFDYGFLKNEFRRRGVSFNARVLCTVKLSRKLYPQHSRHNLDSLLERHSIACESRHRALGDARVLWELAQKWRQELGDALFGTAVDLVVKTPTLPAGLPEAAFDSIPDGPGIYLFYGENDVVLYVGKSVNLRSRVMSHFSGDHRVNKDMQIAQQIKRMDWRETAGELGALLLEARLVKELAPVYNRQLRRNTQLCSWHWSDTNIDCAPHLISAGDIDPTRLGDIYGLFRTRAAALQALREIAAGHGLCNILLGLEKRSVLHSAANPGPCFAHQIKRCHGACVGLESREQHALRLKTALASIRTLPWPFKSRVGVRETTDNGEHSEIHVLDRWCYLGTARSEAELHELAQARCAPVFDIDTYKILARFLGKNSKRCEIVTIAKIKPN